MDMSELERLEAQQGVIKLSDAIRVGARIRPQCQGALFRAGASCALGAAYEGKTGKRCFPNEYSAVMGEFPILGAHGLNDLGRAIFNRNDSGKSREAIADWLESQGY